jgi:hypothetical protein
MAKLIPPKNPNIADNALSFLFISPRHSSISFAAGRFHASH